MSGSNELTVGRLLSILGVFVAAGGVGFVNWGLDAFVARVLESPKLKPLIVTAILEAPEFKPLLKRYRFRVQLCETGHASDEDCEAWGLEAVDSHHPTRRTPIVVRIPADPTVAALRRELRDIRAGGASVPTTDHEGGPP